MQPVSLAKLLNGEEKTILAFRDSLKAHGWCFFEEGTDFTQIGEEIEKFFAEKTEEEKQKFSSSSSSGSDVVLGYSSVTGQKSDGSDGHAFKEKLSYVVGDHKLAKNNRYPNEAVAFAIDQLQKLSKRLLEVTAKPVFGFEKVSDLPVQFLSETNSFALFDCAYYLNQTTADGVPPINCQAHYDPGLLAFSVFSNMSGLQVQNQETKEFLDVPFGKGLGVIWTGDLSFDLSKIPRGIHRVLYPEVLGKPRLTFWLEIAAPSQLDVIMGKARTDGMPSNIFPELDVDVARNQSVEHVSEKKDLLGTERQKGVPTTKNLVHIFAHPPDNPPEQEKSFLKKLFSTTASNSNSSSIERKFGVPASKKRVPTAKKSERNFVEKNVGVPKSKSMFVPRDDDF